MLAAGLVSSAERGWPCLTEPPLGSLQRAPAAAGATRRASGGSDDAVDRCRDLGGLILGNPVPAVCDDAGLHVVSAGFAQSGRHLRQDGGVRELGERQSDRRGQAAGGGPLWGGVGGGGPGQ